MLNRHEDILRSKIILIFFVLPFSIPKSKYKWWNVMDLGNQNRQSRLVSIFNSRCLDKPTHKKVNP